MMWLYPVSGGKETHPYIYKPRFLLIKYPYGFDKDFGLKFSDYYGGYQKKIDVYNSRTVVTIITKMRILVRVHQWIIKVKQVSWECKY